MDFNMRIVCLLMALGVLGCEGHLVATGSGGQVRFSISTSRFERANGVNTIEVFEMEHGQRGRRVCSLAPPSLQAADVVRLYSWEYGKPAAGNYHPVGCEELVRGRPYGAIVYLVGHDVLVTHFKVGLDGSVEDLGIEHHY
jgi:hypothetical protein